MAGLDGKDKDTMDSEEVRMMAKRRAIQTGDSHDWDEMERLHDLRLEFSKKSGAQYTRVSVYRICPAQNLTLLGR